tara:strand:- start:1592 stop:2701 length:1110 start_codon:yes stop_codon:yes gene_type:complete
MDQIIEVHSDTMDIHNSDDEENINEVVRNNANRDINNKRSNIDVKELEDKVKGAMIKMQEIITKKKVEEDSLTLLKKEVEIIKKDELESLKNSKKILDNRLMKCLDEQTKNIIIARRSYHSINNQYWWSSIFILIFSSTITFIEAVRLIIENTENKKIKGLTYIISISSMFIGILITIITGYIKFNDYQNKLEIISSRLSLLLQYQKKFEVIKFQLSTYSLPKNKDNNESVQCRKHNCITKEILKEFSNSLNKLEEDIQNNELLKYITDKNEIRYYREYVDTYIKDIMYNNYIKTLTSYIDNNDNDGIDTEEEVEKKQQILERITKIANTKNNKNIKYIIDYNIFKDIKDLNELKEIKEFNEKEKRYSV